MNSKVTHNLTFLYIIDSLEKCATMYISVKLQNITTINIQFPAEMNTIGS